MKSIRLMAVLAATVVVMVISGCASSKFAQVSSTEDMSGSQFLKMSTKQVEQKLGKPDQRYKELNNLIWEYKKPADAHAFMNGMTKVFTYGMISGADAPYVDLLTLTFFNEVVTKQEYSENVMNVSLPGGLSNQRSIK